MADDSRGAPSKSFATLVRDRSQLADLVAIAGIPAVLVGIFLLPMPVRRSLAFDTADPTLVTAFAGHFVHFSPGHLLGNLVGYAVIVPLTYVLSALAERRRQFRVVFLSLLLGMPFALSLVNWMVLGPGLAIGFSGILLGFYGYLPIVLYQYGTRYAEGSASTRYVPFVFFFGVVSIAAVLANRALFSAVVAVCALLIALVYLSVATDQVSIRGAGVLNRTGFAELGLVGGLLYLLYPLVAFPSNLVLGTRVVNVFAHFMGYSLTFISTYATAMFARWTTFLDSFPDRIEQ